MTALLGGRAVRALLATHGVRPRKELGQNFVTDPNTILKVIDVAGISPADRVLEVGAGVGSLTLGLSAAADHVIAVEKDDRLVAALGESLAGRENVEVVSGDFLRLDLSSFEVTKLVANLPYNVAANALLRTLEEAPQIDEMTVMVQREVGERLAAGAGTSAYGATSVLVAYWASAIVAAQIGRGSFFPQPDVESVLVRLERVEAPRVDYRIFKATVKAAFSQRRKTLRNALASVAGTTAAAARVLESAGIDPLERAERLDARAFARLSNEISA